MSGKCSAPVTGEHKDSTTRMKCPTCGTKASGRANIPTSVAFPPLAQETLRSAQVAQRLTDLMGVRDELGRDLTEDEVARVAESFDLSGDLAGDPAAVLAEAAVRRFLVVETDGDEPFPEGALSRSLREDLPTVPDWLGFDDGFWQVVYDLSKTEVESWSFAALDPDEDSASDEYSLGGVNIASKPYESLHEAIIAKTDVVAENRAALDYLEAFGADAIVEPTHVRLALATHRNP